MSHFISSFSAHSQNICITCGTQYPAGMPRPELCPICSDDRQYIPESGQGWASLSYLENNHAVQFRKINERLYSVKVSPSFALGHRAFLVLSESGNILWDCIPLIDESSAAFIRSLGGLKAIAFSHPHYYSTMNEWARIFDCPIYIHRADAPWIYNQGDAIKLWEGDVHPLWDGIDIVHTGGHFPGSSILRVPFLSPSGTLLTGDSLYAARNKKHIAVMYSYPNQIPLPKKEIVRIRALVQGLPFDSIYSAFDGQNLEGNAREVFERSMERYMEA
jgi:glyoxylase-like metal-dependent hydrolase (beta-lactamase superfamily II)